jgi:hypothetical protein
MMRVGVKVPENSMQYGAIIITELKPVSPRSIHIYLVPFEQFEHFSIPPLLNI